MLSNGPSSALARWRKTNITLQAWRYKKHAAGGTARWLAPAALPPAGGCVAATLRTPEDLAEASFLAPSSEANSVQPPGTCHRPSARRAPRCTGAGTPAVLATAGSAPAQRRAQAEAPHAGMAHPRVVFPHTGSFAGPKRRVLSAEEVLHLLSGQASRRRCPPSPSGFPETRAFY
jgi:hypothetical protein